LKKPNKTSHRRLVFLWQKGDTYEEIQKKKAIERGKFEKRIILDETIEV
jgi:hypothetical protein